MNLRFTREAGQELVEARAWYDDQREGLGEEFQRAFDTTAASLLDHSEVHAVVYRTRRRAFIRRFPYFLLYEIVGETIVVLGCVHFARNPVIWRRRRE